MTIETTVKIIDDDGNIVESRKVMEAAIPVIDAFGDKKKFLDQFDVAEKAIIHANKGASEQALTAYLDEVSKKKTPPKAKLRTRTLDAEIGRISVPVWGKFKKSLQPNERVYAHSFLDLNLTLMASTSDRVAVAFLNKVFHRQGSESLKLRTMTDLSERIGTQISACFERLGTQALEGSEFSPITGLPLPEAQLPLSITNPDVKPISPSVVNEAVNRAKTKNPQLQIAPLTEVFETPELTCYAAVDDIGVKKQKANREKTMASPKKEKKEYVAHTVVKVLSDKEEHTLTGIGMEGVFRVLLGFLLFNQLLTHQSLIFFTDGAKNIRSNINKFFSFRPFRIILDWYHLDKKCGEHLSLGIQGTQKRNQVWEALRRVLWVGDVQAARTYLKGLDMRFIKSKDWIEKLDAYLERNTDFIPCYAVRAELGLKNSIDPPVKYL